MQKVCALKPILSKNSKSQPKSRWSNVKRSLKISITWVFRDVLRNRPRRQICKKKVANVSSSTRQNTSSVQSTLIRLLHSYLSRLRISLTKIGLKRVS